MRWLTRRILCTTVALSLAGAVITTVAWIAATNHGTRWFLEKVIPAGGISFSAQKVEGRLIDHLLLTGVRLNLDRQKLELDRLELRWKPLLLLAGTVAVQELTLNGVRIQDDAPPDNKPLVLAWPRVSRTTQLLDGMIARIRVTDLSYRRLREQPLLVTSVAAAVTWQDDILSIRELSAVSPSGRIQGRASAGFNQPSLTAELAIALTQPLAEMDHFSVLVQHSSSSGPEQFAGKIAMVGSAGTRKLLEIGGDVGMARTAINLRQLSLTRPGRKGVLTAEGSLAFPTRESVLTLQVAANGLDLAPELKIPTNLSGTLKFSGTLDNYRGDIKFTNQAQGWQAATITAAYQGTREGMKLAPLTASVLDGSMTGKLDMDWRRGFALRGALNGRNLNPARIAPDWKGVANFSATGNLAWSGDDPVTGSVHGSLLESSLHGQTLTGELQADFAENNLSLARMALQGKGFDLHASGELNQRITLSAQISDFSRLVPGAAGTLQSEGWVRWRDGKLSGEVAGTGGNFAFGGTRIAAANLTARLDQGTGYPLHFDASLRDVIYKRYSLNAVTVAADGTLPRHTINATLRSAGSDARLTLSAGYSAGTWQGEITKLAGRDGYGPWNMTAPATFAVSAEKLSLSPLTLTAGTTEHLEIDADLALNPLKGQVRAQWTGLNLARANPYLKDEQLTGSSHGTVRLGFLPEKRLTLAGSAAGSGTFTGQGQRITIQRSLLAFDGGDQGMRANIELSTAGGGTLKGTFYSPAPLSLAMPDRGELTAEMSEIDLALLKPWLPPDTGLEGRISGRVNGSMLPAQTGKRLTLAGSLAGSGTFATQGQRMTIQRSLLTFDGGDQGMRANLELTMADSGRLKGTFSSAAPLSLAVPDKGKLSLEMSGIDLALIKPWLPADTGLAGRISGKANGIMLPGQRFELDGSGALSGGTLHQKRTDGELNLSFSSATVTWNWRGETLAGDLSLNMAEYGQARINFQLPLAARFPLAVNPNGPIRASLSGKFQEKGLITALLPGMIQESFGELDADLALNGTWNVPQITGKLRLAKAGAYLPTAGIHLTDVQLAARLEKNLIRIDSYRAVSGKGHIEGSVLLTLSSWRVISYKGTLGGENFQTVNFPEMQVIGSPKFSFEGTPQKITVRGELRLPELNVVSAPSRTVIAPSSDVVREGRNLPAVHSSPLAMDIQVRLLLGEKVFVKVAGIDAQLGGAMDLSLRSLDRITSSGEVKVVKGRYRTYGVNLEIVRGRLFFAGGSIERPSLDFLALRTIGNVRAGVTVSGTLQKPITKLYSEPAMPDVDVLAYIVLGHPIGSSGEQASLLTQAAGALLTSSQAATFQEQLKSKLGLSTLEIQGGVGGTPGSMGYKPLQVTPPGAIPTTQQPGITETMLTVGKYLTPQIYISYGKSLFTGNSQFRLRYDFFKHWQIETQTGSESGADLYYKLEFK